MPNTDNMYAILLPAVGNGFTTRLHVAAGRMIQAQLNDGHVVRPAAAWGSGFDFFVNDSDDGDGCDGGENGTIRFVGHRPNAFSAESFDAMEAQATAEQSLDKRAATAADTGHVVHRFPGSNKWADGFMLLPQNGCSFRHFQLVFEAMTTPAAHGGGDCVCVFIGGAKIDRVTGSLVPASRKTRTRCKTLRQLEIMGYRDIETHVTYRPIV